MTDFFYLFDQILMFSSYEDGQKKFLTIFSSPHRRPIKVSNFTSGWVQYRARRETGDSRAVTSTQERQSRNFSALPSPVFRDFVPNRK